ncbi:MAG: phospholipid carrier-dependent glycosyltransferase, partial [Candidatus Acidiferrales bacterium]
MEKISIIEKTAIGILSALVLWVCFFAHLGAIGFVGPDEPRYAEVAKEMAQSGDWVTPRLYHQAWFEKPILYYWGAAAGFRLHGSDEVAGRLPSALAALIAVLALAWLAWKIYGTATAVAVILILPTTVAGLAFARAAGPDMLFSASLTIAMIFAGDELRHAGALCCRLELSEANSRSAWLSLILFGAALGFAALAKGPAAVILAGGSIGIWALATGSWRPAFHLAHPAAIAAFCAVALPWYVICALRNPDFVRTFLFLHNIERYTTPVFQHRQPFWFFAPVILLGLLPWIALIAGAAREGARTWREGQWRDSPGFFLACWAFFPFLFFSFSQSKLPGYILPAILPLGLLLAIAIVRAMESGAAASRWMLEITGILWVAALALPARKLLKSFPPYASDPL